MSKVRAFQAIVTRYHGASVVKGSRVKATAQGGSITLSWDDALNSQQNHIAAARALAEKFGWAGEWHMGGLPDGHGAQVFVCADTAPMFTTEWRVPR